MKVSSGGGAQKAPSGAQNASQGLDKSSAAAAGIETGGNGLGLAADLVGNQLGHEQSMMGKKIASRTAQHGQIEEASAHVAASRMSAEQNQSKALRESLL